MKKIAESGHVKNVSLYDKMVVDAEETGGSYNPAANELKVVNLNVRKDEVHLAMETLDAAEAAKSEAVNQRQFIYEELLLRSTRVVGEALACGADEKLMADIHTWVRKLRGQRAKAIEEPVIIEPAPVDGNVETGKAGGELAKIVKRSVSQQSFDNRLGHFRKVIEIVAMIVGYIPNEAEMTILGLKALATEAEAATHDVNQKTANVDAARTMRDKLLYRKVTGIIFLGQRVKGYFRATFGPQSNEYKKVKDVRFKKYEYKGL